MDTRILLCGYPNDAETGKLTDFLKNSGIDTKVLIASTPGSVMNSRIDVFFHAEMSEICLSQPLQIDPQGAVFLRNQYPIILRAMSRWDESIANPDDKMLIIDSLFFFFSDLIKKHHIKVVVFGTGSPHHFYNLVLYNAAQYNQVKTLFPITNWVTNRVRFVSRDFNFTVPVQGFGSGNEQMVNYLKEIKYGKEILTFDSKRIFRDKTTSNYLLFLVRVLLPRLLGRTKFILKKEKDLFLNGSDTRVMRIITLWRKTLAAEYFKHIYKKRYRKHQFKDITPVNSVVFYAQNQPEATSHPDGGFYPDMRYWYDVFNRMGRSVYYKEHKANFIYHQDGYINDTQHHRSLFYLDFFIRKKVGLLADNFPTAKVFEHNNAIFTFSGSVILESVIKGAEVYYCGLPFHGDLPGTEVIADNDGFVLKKGNPVEIDELAEFFNKLDIYSVPNYSGFSTAKREDVPFDQYADFICRVIRWSVENIDKP